MGDPTPGNPPDEVAEELMLDADELARSDVELQAHGEGGDVHVDLSIGTGRRRRHWVLVPDRFVDDNVVDVAALVAWLGLADDQIDGLPATATLVHHPHRDGDGEWEVSGGEDGALYLGAYPGFERAGPLVPPEPPVPPTQESGDVFLAGEEHVGSYPRPALGDTDAWPDDVDGWRAAIRRLRNQNTVLRAADVRMFFAGLDDQVVELTADGPVDQAGNPVHPDRSPSGESWDPATDPLDPALEEALRLEEVLGALPPPDAAPESTPDPAPGSGADPNDEDLVEVELDNTVAIVEGSYAAEGDEEPVRRFRWFSADRAVWWWLGLALVALVVIVGFCASQLSSDGSSDPDAATPTDQVEPTPEPAEPAEETAQEALQRATQDLLDARTAEVEQTFTVTTPAGETVTTATGAIDFGESASRLDLDIIERGVELELELVITPEGYEVRAVVDDSPWIAAEPGQIGNDPAATEAGLGLLGIGETMDPLAIFYLAHAAQDVTVDGAGPNERFAGTTTLPITGDGADQIDRWTTSIFGRDQVDLPGIPVRTTVVLGEDEKVTIGAIIELEDAIDAMGDDPLAENLRGITLANEITYTPGAPFPGTETEGEVVSLEDYLELLDDQAGN